MLGAKNHKTGLFRWNDQFASAFKNGVMMPVAMYTLGIILASHRSKIKLNG
jgi:hypothetical protein